MANDPLSLIRKRKAEMAAQRERENAERARLDAEASARAKEEEELAVAERVYARLAGKAQISSASNSAAVAPHQKGAAKVGGSPRPPGLPTVPEMVTKLLLEAEQGGKRGLTSSEIMAGIHSKWWPGVSINLIMPTVYRAMSKGYWFTKEDRLIMRLRDGQPPRRGGGQSQLKLDS
jgi:hypothetical protein